MTEQTEWRRLSFDERADEYRLARPLYPDRVYQVLANRCGLGPGSRLLEIGPGTGQATRELLARGADVVAVEPGARLADHLVADLPGASLRVIRAGIEKVELPDAAFDLVVSATAFHWVRPDVTLPKLARSLRPGGWLAVWWTEFGDRRRPTEFRAGLDELYAHYLPDERRGVVPERGPMNVESWCAELSQGGHFRRPEVEQIPWEHTLTADGARRLFGSFPNVNELGSAERAELLDAIGVLVQRLVGVVEDPYVTVLYLTQPSKSEG
jgi:SAM-dependent methyltransferase